MMLNSLRRVQLSGFLRHDGETRQTQHPGHRQDFHKGCFHVCFSVTFSTEFLSADANQ
jgi:hypothetical protein